MKKKFNSLFWKITLNSLAVILLSVVLMENIVAQCASGIITFDTVPGNTIQTFTVPAGVTSINIAARGGDGGQSATFQGGSAASLSGTYPVTPGQTISIAVGKPAKEAPMIDGFIQVAAGGGGGTFVYMGATPIVVAGGGGGASRTVGGGSSTLYLPGALPSAGGVSFLHSDGNLKGSGGGGGAGFLGIGADGQTSPSVATGGGMGGGDNTAGFGGGAGGISTFPLFDLDGFPGAFGGGGGGGATDYFTTTNETTGGGGGGGGFIGGNGGDIIAFASEDEADGEGGDGGTSYVSPLVFNFSITLGADGAGSKVPGQVTISYAVSDLALTCPPNRNVSYFYPACFVQISKGFLPKITTTCTTSSITTTLEVTDPNGDIIPSITDSTSFESYIFSETGNYTIKMTVTDDFGGMAMCTHEIGIVDNSFIRVSCPPDQDLIIGNGCTASLNNLTFDPAFPTCTSTTLFEDLEVKDTLTNSLLPITNLTELNAYAFPAGGYKVKRIVTDDLGKMGMCEFLIKVTGGTALSVTCPADLSYILSGNCTSKIDPGLVLPAPTGTCMGTTLTDILMVTDDNGITLSPTNLAELVAFDFPIGTFTVERTVTDDFGRMANCSFSINVTGVNTVRVNCFGSNSINRAVDPMTCTATIEPINFPPPTLCPGSTVEADTFKVTDALGNTLPITTLADLLAYEFPLLGNGNPINNFSVKRIVTTDKGEMGMCAFQLIISGNSTPTVVCPGPIAVPANSDCQATLSGFPLPAPMPGCVGSTITVDTFEVTNVAGDILPITDFNDLTSFPFSIGIFTIKRIVRNDAGFMAMCTFDLTVEDNSPPTVEAPADVTVSTADNKCDTIVMNLAPVDAMDNCAVNDTVWVVCYENGIPVVTEEGTGDVSGQVSFPIGTHTLKYVVTDEAGLESDTAYSTITVTDGVKPICMLLNGGDFMFDLDAAGNFTLNADTIISKIIDIANSSDNCGVDLNNPATYRLTDANGNDLTGIGNLPLAELDCTDFANNPNEFILYISDENGNESIGCPITITLNDPSNTCLQIDFEFGLDIDSNLAGSQIYNCQAQCVTATLSNTTGNPLIGRDLEIIIERGGMVILTEDFPDQTDANGQAIFCFGNTDQITGDVQVTVRCR